MQISLQFAFGTFVRGMVKKTKNAALPALFYVICLGNDMTSVMIKS